MPVAEDCFTCRNNALVELPPQEAVLRDGSWRVAHAFGTKLPGWLVVVPTRHVTSLADLSVSEAAELGPLLRDVTRALVQAVGCTKSYVALFAEAEGFEHVHFHVIPRMPDQDVAFRGPRVFQLLGASQEASVPGPEMASLCRQLTAILKARRSST